MDEALRKPGRSKMPGRRVRWESRNITRREFGLWGAGLAVMAAGGCKRETKLEALSEAELRALEAALDARIRNGELPGLVAMISRGDTAHVHAAGVQDIETRASMRRDTIFRVASMTKPVTAAATMILVEEGKFGLDDPIDRFLPELADRRVLRTMKSPLDDTVPAVRPISVRDLLTSRMGLGAVFAEPGAYPILKAMAERELAPSANVFSHSQEEYLRRIGELPLIHQPGERWLYHTGLDVAGILVARASGKGFGDFLAERILAPLGMRDTGFSVPAGKVARLASAYMRGPDGKSLVVFDPAEGGRWSRPPAFESGGGGLASTVDDYNTFGRMLLGKGQAGDVRILRPESVTEMMKDQISPAQKEASPFFPGFWDNQGWGLGMAVVTRPDEVSAVPGRCGWFGGYGTTFFVDPHRNCVATLLFQRVMSGADDTKLGDDFLRRAFRAAEV
jgi:CubicO group peptidase (beta-lactamase class C family)